MVEIGALYEAHGSWLRSWLERKTKCRQRAADLVQDTFCRLIERPHYADPGSPRSFLATVARRLLIDDVRRRDVERAILGASAYDGSGVDLISPERILQAADLLACVLRVIETLPSEAREAFLLRRLEGLEQREIAARLGISVSTVKRHIALAYAQCYELAYAD